MTCEPICVQSMPSAMGCVSSTRRTRSLPFPLPQLVWYRSGAPRVSTMVDLIVPQLMGPRSLEGVQAGAAHPPMPKHEGSAQSMSPLASSSMPLLQISMGRFWKAEMRRFSTPGSGTPGVVPFVALKMRMYWPADRSEKATAPARSSSAEQPRSLSVLSQAVPAFGCWKSENTVWPVCV